MIIPEDEELRNIIDKLANFVARNGPQFEQLTKSKQQDNPKFSFLFGGDYHQYYKWKVGVEATQANAQARKETQNPTVLARKETQPEKTEEIPKLEGFDIKPFKELLQKLIITCTKDNIQNGKNWIVEHAKTDDQLKKVSQYFLRRMLEENLPFQQKLHIVYLTNDLLHHSRKKDLPHIHDGLEHYVLPMIAMSFHDATAEQQAKLVKVLNIWNTQTFFKEETRELLKKHDELVDIQAERVRQERTIMDEEQKPKEPPPQEKVDPPPKSDQQYQNYDQWSRPPPQGPPPYYPPQGQFPPQQFQQPPPGFQQGGFPPQGQPGYQEFGQFPPTQTFDYSHQSIDQNAAPPATQPPVQPMTFDYEHGRAPLPDGAPPPPAMADPTIPQAPYFDLPAGLMVPLVKLWDSEYKPIDPKDIRLPIPQPPSERLLAALEAFYSAPSHDRPRDNQGWEKNGLFEFYKAKLKYIKDKDKNLEVFDRSPSPPPSPDESNLDDDHEVEQWIKPAPDDRSRSRSRSRSHSPRGRRSRSRSPYRKRSYSRSRSRSHSASPRRSERRSRSKSRSVSRSPVRRSPIRRSPTPPESFVGFATKTLDSKIEEDNKGHQLLKKMGWGGQGLGKNEQGVADPIRQGEVRDKMDKFKGVGAEKNDPFENYRKTKSYTYSRPFQGRK